MLIINLIKKQKTKAEFAVLLSKKIVELKKWHNEKLIRLEKLKLKMEK